MKLIIAGGRDYFLTKEEFGILKRLHQRTPISEVVCGGANGVDACGKVFAIFMDIPVKDMPADWTQYGKGAGFLRNIEMAKYADAVALFQGGKGTAHMHDMAKVHDLDIYDYRK